MPNCKIGDPAPMPDKDRLNDHGARTFPAHQREHCLELIGTLHEYRLNPDAEEYTGFLSFLEEPPHGRI